MVKRKWFYAVGGVVAVALIAVIVGSNLTGGNLKGMSFTLPSKAASPILTKNTIPTVLHNGEVTLYSVAAAAPTDKDVLINQLCFNVTKSDGVSVDSFKLFNESADLVDNNKVTLTSSLGLCGTQGATGVKVKWNSAGDVISAGTYKDYLLKGIVDGVAGVVPMARINTGLSSSASKAGVGSQVLSN